MNRREFNKSAIAGAVGLLFGKLPVEAMPDKLTEAQLAQVMHDLHLQAHLNLLDYGRDGGLLFIDPDAPVVMRSIVSEYTLK